MHDATMRVTWLHQVESRIEKLKEKTDSASKDELTANRVRVQRFHDICAGRTSDGEVLRFWQQELESPDHNPWPSLYAVFTATEHMYGDPDGDRGSAVVLARDAARRFQIEKIDSEEEMLARAQAFGAQKFHQTSFLGMSNKE